jgi:hypothetical protein
MNPEPKAEQPRGGDPMAAKTAQHNTTNSVTLTNKKRERNQEYAKSFPLLRGFIIGNAIAILCPFCDRIHKHGWDPKDGSQVEDFKVAHCGGRERLKAYRIAPFRQRDLNKLEGAARNILGIELPLTKLGRVSKKYAQEKAAQKAARKVAEEGQTHGN